MTLSVPSFLAAATSAFMPPPAAAEVAVAQLVPLPEPEAEPGGPDEQPAASSAAAAIPAIANLCEDLTVPPESFLVPKWMTAARKAPGATEEAPQPGVRRIKCV